MGLIHPRALGNPGIQLRSHLWIWWGEIAIEHEAEALEARRRAIEITPAGRGFGEPFRREGLASMVAISASAHALDALYGAVKPTVEQIAPPATAERRPANILETLKAGFVIKGSAGGGRWASDFAWLFVLRDAAVHFEEKFQPTVPHPTGTNSAVESIDYSLEAATRAVDLMLEVLQKCVSAPRPALSEWAEGMRSAVGRLVETRSSLSG